MVDPKMERREDRVTLELHRIVAEKLAADPEAVLAAVPKNLASLRTRVRSPLAQEWIDDWERLTTGNVGELIRVMLGTNQRSKDLRQNSPFAGVLTQEERLEAIRRAAKP